MHPWKGLLATTSAILVLSVPHNDAFAFGKPKPKPTPVPTATSTPVPTPTPTGAPVFNEASATKAVTRAYRAILFREPDEGGLQSSVNHVLAQQMAGWKSTLRALSSSAEFNQSVRPNHSNEQILEQFYTKLLLRSADPGGKAAYLPQLDQGRYGDVAESIGASSEFFEALGKPDGPVVPPVVFCGRLRAQGKNIVCPDGTRFQWKMVSFFGGVDLIADGKEAEAEEALKWFASKGANGVRAFAMMDPVGQGGMFPLSPDEGRAALPRFLELARKYGIYVEIVALANTRVWVEKGFDMEHHVREVGRIAAAHENTVVEYGNETYHGTQLNDLQEWISTRRHLVPSHVMSATGQSDENYYHEPDPVVFDYISVHSERADGDAGWRFVRHVKDVGDLARKFNKPVVDNEPIGAGEVDHPGRRTNSPAKYFGLTLVGRVSELAGTTFHYELGLRWGIPSGRQLECFDAFMKAMSVIPDGTSVNFQNKGWDGAPIDDFNFSENGAQNSALRTYSGITGNRGWTAVVHKVGDPGIRWHNGWAPVSSSELYPGMELIEIAR